QGPPPVRGNRDAADAPRVLGRLERRRLFGLQGPQADVAPEVTDQRPLGAGREGGGGHFVRVGALEARAGPPLPRLPKLEGRGPRQRLAVRGLRDAVAPEEDAVPVGGPGEAPD